MTVAARSSAALSGARRFLDWWAAELSDMLAPRGPSSRPWQVMFLRRGAGCDVFVRSRRGIEQVATPQTGRDHLLKELRRRLGKAKVSPAEVVLRLQPSDLVQTRISVPAAAREVMEPILRNQIERLAPWPADKALFAYEVDGDARDQGALDVQLAVAGRSMVEVLVRELETLGYRPGVVDYGPDATAPPRVNLLPRRELGAAGGRGRLVVWLIGVVLGVSLVAGAIGLVQYGRRVAKINDYTAKLEQLGARSKAAPRTDDDAGSARRLAWLAGQKLSQPSMAIMLEALSRALPDEAWLSRLEVSQGSVTIAGSATNAARLIGLLEASQHFSEVHFSAPTTRAEGEAVDSFTITAKIVPGRELR